MNLNVRSGCDGAVKTPICRAATASAAFHHAHAHAMIFGWVGMFVMGFAYQSFPRFKITTLWRPDLANISFYLLAAGIVTGMAADMLLPSTASFVLGVLSGAAELTSVGLFMLVLYRTARQSLDPHNRTRNSSPAPSSGFCWAQF